MRSRNWLVTRSALTRRTGSTSQRTPGNSGAHWRMAIAGGEEDEGRNWDLKPHWRQPERFDLISANLELCQCLMSVRHTNTTANAVETAPLWTRALHAPVLTTFPALLCGGHTCQQDIVARLAAVHQVLLQQAGDRPGDRAHPKLGDVVRCRPRSPPAGMGQLFMGRPQLEASRSPLLFQPFELQPARSFAESDRKSQREIFPPDTNAQPGLGS